MRGISRAGGGGESGSGIPGVAVDLDLGSSAELYGETWTGLTRGVAVG